VQNYGQAVSWAAQTALRDIIGRTTLTELLRGREQIEAELQRPSTFAAKVINGDVDCAPIPAGWPVSVLQSAESRDQRLVRGRRLPPRSPTESSWATSQRQSEASHGVTSVARPVG
jgi:hypothetical protein